MDWSEEVVATQNGNAQRVVVRSIAWLDNAWLLYGHEKMLWRRNTMPTQTLPQPISLIGFLRMRIAHICWNLALALQSVDVFCPIHLSKTLIREHAECQYADDHPAVINVHYI